MKKAAPFYGAALKVVPAISKPLAYGDLFLFFDREVIAGVAVGFGVFADVLGYLHGAEGWAAHGTEVGGFGIFCWEGFVVVVDGAGWV